jgi:ATP-dependent protease ClpP protease subunit
VLEVFGIIGDERSGQALTAPAVSAALAAIGDRDVEVHINSPGGDAFEGIAVYNLLRQHPGAVTVKIMGMAASAASVIAMAGDRILFGRGAELMIHCAWVFAIGNRHDLADAIKYLEGTDASLVDIYSARSGQKPDAIAKWMNDETFMTAADAIARGFGDGSLEDGDVVDDPAFAATALTHPAPSATKPPAPQITGPRDLETLLKGAGLATAAARKVAAGGWPALASTPTATITSDEQAAAAAALAARINKAASDLRKAMR